MEAASSISPEQIPEAAAEIHQTASADRYCIEGTARTGCGLGEYQQ